LCFTLSRRSPAKADRPDSTPTRLSSWPQAPPANPNGIESLSPGLARFGESLPWVLSKESRNPERSLCKKDVLEHRVVIIRAIGGSIGFVIARFDFKVRL